MNQIIVCNGGYRTGSTVVFNIVRSLIKEQDLPFVAEGIANWLAEEYCRKRQKCPRILKIHSWFPDWECKKNVYFLYTYRNLLDVAASNLTISYGGDWSRVMAYLYLQKAQEELMRKRKDALLISYDDIFNDLAKVVQSIAHFLELTVESGIRNRIANDWSLESVKKKIVGLKGVEADSVTQFRANHISKITGGKPGGWKKVLTEDQARQVKEII